MLRKERQKFLKSYIINESTVCVLCLWETFTSIHAVIPLWIDAEFPDTVVLWLTETSTVGVEL